VVKRGLLISGWLSSLGDCVAVVGIGLYVALLLSKVGADAMPLPHLFRRWLAGILDFAWAMVIPCAFIGLAAILFEYRRTGTFEWLVERQTPEPGDWLIGGVSVLLLLFVFIPTYFAVFWRLGKPTPGSCVFNFRIVTDEGRHLSFWKAELRAFLGSMALFAWPCWILAYWMKRDRSAGKFWLDVVFRTHAEFLG
jgi:uncharacterized RDD family membrane protein YckC